MPWLIPLILLGLALTIWRASFTTDDAIVAWCRFCLALLILILAAMYAMALLVQKALA